MCDLVKSCQSNPSPVIQHSFNTDTFTCIRKPLTHSNTHKQAADRAEARRRPQTHESGEPVNLLARFEGLRVVE